MEVLILVLPEVSLASPKVPIQLLIFKLLRQFFALSNYAIVYVVQSLQLCF